jgi:hypothetical protein
MRPVLEFERCLFENLKTSKPIHYRLRPLLRTRALISCLAHSVVGGAHHPSTSTAFLAKPRRLRRRRFTRPCGCLYNKTNSRNASHRRRRILPCCAADELRVGGFLGSFPCAIGLWQKTRPLIWADLRREGPISAYAAVTDCRLDPPKLLLSILRTEYETPPVRKLGQVGRET